MTTAPAPIPVYDPARDLELLASVELSAVDGRLYGGAGPLRCRECGRPATRLVLEDRVDRLYGRLACPSHALVRRHAPGAGQVLARLALVALILVTLAYLGVQVARAIWAPGHGPMILG